MDVVEASILLPLFVFGSLWLSLVCRVLWHSYSIRLVSISVLFAGTLFHLIQSSCVLIPTLVIYVAFPLRSRVGLRVMRAKISCFFAPQIIDVNGALTRE